jgi:signal transduction histidine kinase
MLLTFFVNELKATENNVLRLTHFNVVRNNSGELDTNNPTEAIVLPDSWHEHHQTPFRNSWYRTDVTFGDGNSPFAVYIPRASMNVSVAVNGKEIGNAGRFSEPISRNHGRPLLFIAPSWITNGSNAIDLTIRVTDNHWAFGYLGPVYVGDIATLTAMYQTREFWQVQLTMALALLMLIFSIASFALFMRRRNDKYYFWFGSAMFLFAVDTFNVFVIDIPTDRLNWEIYNQIVVYAFAVATIIFIHRFTRVGWQWIEPILGIILLLKLFTLHTVDIRYFFITASIFNLAVIGYGLILAVLVIRSYLRTSNFEAGITALSGLILLAVASHTLLVQLGILDPENLHIIHYGAPCFFLLISLSLVRKFLTSLENTEALACELDKRVQEKEKELAATYEALNILNQKKTLSEERARIMREVHDGFGAHLVGAMTMLETQDVDYEELSDFLKSSLLDLRIMIDSLDPDTHDVLFALSMLRTRVEPILKNKNITLDWNLTQLPQDLELNPNRTLSLLRVLQELFTNILKHSVANHVRITSAIEDSQQERILKLDFFENGKGFHPELKSGRGIRNICNRIRELNGQIDYCQACDGFRTVISIPGFPRVG